MALEGLVDLTLHMSALGHPVRIKYVPVVGSSATRHRPTFERPHKPPRKSEWHPCILHSRPLTSTKYQSPSDVKLQRIHLHSVRKLNHVVVTSGSSSTGPVDSPVTNTSLHATV